MVYGGKPSRGCRTCRTRRIKCDEGKPVCQKCIKSNRVCGGYRDEFDYVHRDETGRTKDKVQRKLGKQFFQQVTQVIAPHVQEQASCFFASNFILAPMDRRAGVGEGFFKFLLPLIDQQPPDSALRHAYNACAIGCLGNRKHSQSVNLDLLALEEHTRALKSTQKALSHVTEWKSDSTLAAVLLLTLYENIKGADRERMQAWQMHVEAAMRIVKARGRGLRQSKTGMLLFQTVRQRMVAHVLSSGAPLPMGSDWWIDEHEETFMTSHVHRFCLKASEYSTESSRLLNSLQRTPENIDLMLEMARRVQKLDQEIATFLVTLPEGARFETYCYVWEDEIGNPQTADDWAKLEAYPGRIDVYPDIDCAGIWNLARVSRLVLSSVNMRLTAWLCAPADYRTTGEYTTSRRICEGVVSDIVASIPYHLGWRTKASPAQKMLPGALGFAAGDDSAIRSLPALWASWPLACMHCHDFTPEPQRMWIRGRLEYIATAMGLKYTKNLYGTYFRFPSMLIARDGLNAMVRDPFKQPKDHAEEAESAASSRLIEKPSPASAQIS